MSYMGFDKLKSELSKKGVRSPGGLAATIGRKKYGAQKFNQAAARGQVLESKANRQKDEMKKQAAVVYGSGTIPKAKTPHTTSSVSAPPTVVPFGQRRNNTNNARKGQYYREVQGNGGVYHVYGNGKRVFVRSKSDRKLFGGKAV